MVTVNWRLDVHQWTIPRLIRKKIKENGEWHLKFKWDPVAGVWSLQSGWKPLDHLSHSDIGVLLIMIATFLRVPECPYECETEPFSIKSKDEPELPKPSPKDSA